jgi:hypothetical protein
MGAIYHKVFLIKQKEIFYHNVVILEDIKVIDFFSLNNELDSSIFQKCYRMSLIG